MDRGRWIRTGAFAAGTAALCALGGGAAAKGPSTFTVKPSGGDFASIQAAIDAAMPGDRINVYPGDYLEVASGRTLASFGGTYQFGLFIGVDRGGITVQGVDAKGHVIHDWAKVAAHVTTDATNNFGPSGIFVEGDGVTISGLDIGVNVSGQNKTVEVLGDDFSLLDCDISDLYGSVYFGDERFDTDTDTSHIRSYRIEGNRFQDNVSLDIANGAGYSGDVKSRTIRGNDFFASEYWPSISFNGSDTGVPWFVHSVGGAVIKGNSFVNTFESATDFDTEGHIRARGTYDNSQFNWGAYWRDNKYDAAFVVGPDAPKDVRTYSYAAFYGTISNVRRIGALLAGEEAHRQTGDKLLAK